MTREEDLATPFDAAADDVVQLGNKIAVADQEADMWEIADGLVAGALQYWLYARQPCADLRCEDCAPYATAELRLAELMKLVRQLAEQSEYFHAPTDSNVGRA